MLLFSILLFCSDSNEQPSFVTMGSNSPVALSPEADRVLSEQPFFIVISGEPGT
jgi:hypothetical protein